MIEVKNVGKTYRSKKRNVVALNDINLFLPDKGLIFILGESGSGKSTFLNIISQRIEPSSGKIFIDGDDVTNLSKREAADLRNLYFGCVFQENNLLEHVSVYENIRIARRMQGGDLTREEAVEVLDRCGIGPDLLREYPENLSGGQRQRVCVARVLAKDSKVLCCDEPTGSLDEENSATVMELLKEIAKDKLVLVVSHSEELCSAYSERTIRISGGEISSDDHPQTAFVSSDSGEVEKQGIKLGLRFREKLMLAFKSFSKGKVRTIISIISFSILLALGVFSYSVLNTDADKVAAIGIADNGVTYGAIEKSRADDDDEGDILSHTIFNESELKMAEEVYGPVLPLDEFDDANIKKALEGAAMATLQSDLPLNGIIEAADVDLSEFGLAVYGRIPLEGYSMMVSSYTCSILGWIENNEVSIKEAIEEKVIGRVIAISDWSGEKVYATVTAVFDSGISLGSELSDFQSRYGLDTSVILSPDLFGLQATNPMSAVFFYGNAPKNYFLLDEYASLIQPSGFSLKSRALIDGDIENYSGQSTALYIYLVFGAIVFTLIFVFSFSSYARFSVQFGRKNDAILSSLGARRSDLMAISLITGLLIVVATFVLSFAFYAIGITSLNGYVLSMGHLVKPYYFEPVGMLFGFLLAVLLGLASFLLAFSNYKGQPD